MHIQALEVETGEVLDAVEHGRADLGIGHLIGDANRAVNAAWAATNYVLVHRSVAPAVRGDSTWLS